MDKRIDRYICDTNVLLDYPEIIEKYNIVLISHVLRELEKYKTNRNSDLAFKARQATRYINNHKKVAFDFRDYQVGFDKYVDGEYVDNKIIEACLQNKYKLITNDILLKLKAIGYGIEVVNIDSGKHISEGLKEVYMTDDELSYTYKNLDKNRWNLHINQYLIIKNKESDKDIDCFKWDGQYLIRVNPKGFTTTTFGKFKPYDFYQKAAVDSILSNDITCLMGKAGSGKSLIALNTAWNLIERGKYDRLIVFTNPVKTRNAEALGFYKGTRTEKLQDSQIGIMLASKFGDEMAVQMAINNNKLMLLPFSDIRGFDTTSEAKTIVWFTEAQNTDVDLMKLGLQRIGENTKVIIDGDPNTQVDMDVYKNNNGMKRMSEVFIGKDFYGEVELKNIYRSKIAKVADEM